MIQTPKRWAAGIMGVIFAAALCGSPMWAGPTAAKNLRVEDQVDPIGIGSATPKFSWEFQNSQPNQVQTAYQILAASTPEKLTESQADCWDSHKVAGADCAYISYQGKALQSRQVCYWAVRTWDRAGQAGPWSRPGRFEIGLLDNADWSGQWVWGRQWQAEIAAISAATTPAATTPTTTTPPPTTSATASTTTTASAPAPAATTSTTTTAAGTAGKNKKGRDHVYFRRVFDLPDKAVVRGRVYITACQHQELYINGQWVGQGPNFAYPDSAYYQTFDITPMLQRGGKNVIGVLGHWFGAGQGRPGGRPGLLVEAVIDFTDGGSVRVASDKNWKTTSAEWLVTGQKKEDFRNGEGIPAETIDARKHPVGWEHAGFDDSGWSDAFEIGRQPVEPWSGRLTAQNTRIAECTIPPVSIKKLGPGHYVADFGKVYAGRPVIDFRGGKTGDTVHIKADYREKPDGMLEGYAQDTKLNYPYTLRGGEETFLPFWYLGFRYVEVENSPCELNSKNLRLIVRHHEVESDLSSFACSNATINAVWDLAKHSVMMGMHENFVDTPTREQGQFTYDTTMTSLAAMKCFRERTLTQKAIREFAQSQGRYYSDTGNINCIYPNGDGKRNIPDWSQAWVWWVWDYYMQTGDTELVREVFEPMVRLGQFVHSAQKPDTGLIDFGNNPKYRSGIVDWPNRYGYDMLATQRTVMSINAWRDYHCIAEIAKIIGRDDVATTFEGYADAMLAAIRKRFWSGDPKNAYIDGIYADNTPSAHASQQAGAMMLALNIIEPWQAPYVLDTVRCAGHTTSPLLAHFLVQAYGQYEQQDAFYEYLTNPRGRNWAYILADGGTFTYENWRGRQCGWENSESHSYTALGAVIAVQDYILGLTPLAPQYERMQIKPLIGELAFAWGVVPTQRGPVAIDWENNHRKNILKLTVTLPANTVADVCLPKLIGNGAGSAVTLDGRKIDAKTDGDCLRIADIGSGKHTLVRRAK